ncbi:MAG: hypothetical protein IJ713_08510 [Oscillibacter sp.]|nr:hypothetical protein [Oscillibacter sp.]
MKIEKGSTASMILSIVGLCGEFPVSLVRLLSGYYDYNRRLVTRLAQEGYLLEWRFTYNRRVIRSLRLSASGKTALYNANRKGWNRINKGLLSPPDANGSVEKAIRLHRNAACFVMAEIGARTNLSFDLNEPGRWVDPVYFSAYMIRKLTGADSKGSRASGVITSSGKFYLLYAPLNRNMRWNTTAEDAFLSRVNTIFPDHVFRGRIFLADRWELAGSILARSADRFTRLIRLQPDSRDYLVAIDGNGAKLLRAIVDDTAFSCLFNRCRDYGVEETYELYAPLFELNEWAAFRGKPEYCPLHDPFCFDFQQSAVEQINKYRRLFHVLPSAVLNSL